MDFFTHPIFSICLRLCIRMLDLMQICGEWDTLDDLPLYFLQAMVTRFSSISTRKLSRALELLTSNKNMVAMSDYGDFHKMVKRFILTSVLGTNAQVCITKFSLC